MKTTTILIIYKIYLCSNISSTESDVVIRIGEAWTVIKWLLTSVTASGHSRVKMQETKGYYEDRK